MPKQFKHFLTTFVQEWMDVVITGRVNNRKSRSTKRVFVRLVFKTEKKIELKTFYATFCERLVPTVLTKQDLNVSVRWI